MLFKELFDPPVIARETGLSSFSWMLFPDELTSIAGSVERRRREFAGGRACAREAMAVIGLPVVSIPSGSDRAPIWPPGVVGSISHSSIMCIAAVARKSDGFTSIGVDIEEASPLEKAFAIDICTPFERSWLDRQPCGDQGLLLKTLFSAKECAYKCQYPLSKRLLGFDQMHIELDVGAQLFTARFEVDAAPFRTGDRLDGRLVFAGGHIASAISLR